MALKAFIFDLDGTIIQSGDLVKKMLQAYCTPQEYAALMVHYGVLTGFNERQAVPFIYRMLNRPGLSMEQLAQDLSQLAHAIKQQRGIALVQGFEQFYNDLTQRGMRHCIATNGMGSSLATTIKLAQLDRFFDTNIYTPEHVGGVAKPKPDLFLYALDAMGCKPEEAVIFEDSHTGVAAAHAAGIACVGINTGNHLDKDEHNLIACVPHYDQLSVALIEQAHAAHKKRHS